MLGVDPSARRRGIARTLMAEAERLARDAGKGEITLNTTERMQAAQRMYEALGYERIEDTVFPDGFVLLGYRKRLA
jgi:ribosomal protein S18 acetylase RimI-like enzyme